MVSHDRIEDFARILKQTEQPIRKLNEEMGVEVHAADIAPQRDTSVYEVIMIITTTCIEADIDMVLIHGEEGAIITVKVKAIA